MLKKIFSSKNRWFSALVIALVGLSFIFMTYYLEYIGRIIGLISYLLLGIFALFEITKSYKIDKKIAITFSLVLIPFFLFEYIDFLYVINNGVKTFKDNLYMLFNWKSWVIVIIVSLMPMFFSQNNYETNFQKIISQFLLTLAYLVICVFIKFMWIVNMKNILIMLFFIFTAVISDSFAYFGGMFFGTKWFKGKKFAPKLSPKKTWAGFLIGFFFSIIFAITYGYFMGVWSEFKEELIISISMGVLLSFISPFGDLFFSIIKRRNNIKDFSNLIPGHGGLMDRFDALSVISFVSLIFFLIFS